MYSRTSDKGPSKIKKQQQQKTNKNLLSRLTWCKLISEIRTASLQGTVDLIPMCPLFRGSTVLQGTVDLIPMCPLFRGSTVLQGTVDLIPMCPLFRGSTCA